LPPDFARHCVAVAVWGSHLGSIWDLALCGMAQLLMSSVRGRAPQLASWLPGKVCCGMPQHTFFLGVDVDPHLLIGMSGTCLTSTRCCIWETCGFSPHNPCTRARYPRQPRHVYSGMSL
jgi:hypothetical protein